MTETTNKRHTAASILVSIQRRLDKQTKELRAAEIFVNASRIRVDVLESLMASYEDHEEAE